MQIWTKWRRGQDKGMKDCMNKTDIVMSEKDKCIDQKNIEEKMSK